MYRAALLALTCAICASCAGLQKNTGLEVAPENTTTIAPKVHTMEAGSAILNLNMMGSAGGVGLLAIALLWTRGRRWRLATDRLVDCIEGSSASGPVKEAVRKAGNGGDTVERAIRSRVKRRR